MPTKASHYIQHRQQKRKHIDLSHLLLLLLFLAAFCSFSVVHASDTISLSPPVTSVSKTMVEDYLRDKDIKVVFSDVDGTLIHYPDQIMVDEKDDEDRIWLPPSSTGMRGVISKRTFVLCQSLREEKGVKLVLVSGMRSSTLIQRLPFLPKADAYCSEGGGRIFYPMKDDVGNGYALKEDLSWRKTMEALDAAGSDGYGPSVGDFKDNVIQSAEDVISNIPIFERKGILWEFASSLKRKGWNIDYKGYATSFRIKFTADSEGTMDELLDLIPRELSCSVNLGMSDVYPKNSGKKNCCIYLCNVFGGESLSESSICLCDDDNDIEMALACSHAFLPAITSSSMRAAVDTNLSHFTITYDEVRNVSETAATDEALDIIRSILK